MCQLCAPKPVLSYALTFDEIALLRSTNIKWSSIMDHVGVFSSVLEESRLDPF